jgi:hypothetical protein
VNIALPQIQQGLHFSSAGLAWEISAYSLAFGGLLGPLLLWGAGIGLTFMPLNMVILAGLQPKDTGSASGLLQCLQQVGAAIGVAVLTTVFGTSMRHSANTAHAIATALIVAAAFSGAALLVTVFILKQKTAAT